MIKIFLDSGDISVIRKYANHPLVSGVTTNPSLMYKAGITDYEKFAKEVLNEIKDRPVSLEVFADDFDEMERQARKIASWGENVYVKIPITNAKGKSSIDLINKLNGINLNITAVLTEEQIEKLVKKALIKPMSIISVFCGRMADTGRNPEYLVAFAKKVVPHNWLRILWASPREVLNIYQAEQAGADIITCTPDLIEKYEKLKGKDLNEFSLETVKQFYEDGQKAGFKL